MVTTAATEDMAFCHRIYGSIPDCTVGNVTETLKMQDQMKWVGLMNNIKTCAEQIVLKDMVYDEF